MDKNQIVVLVLGVSIILEALAAVMAVRLVNVTGRRAAWVLVSLALALMALRRVILFYRLLAGERDFPLDMSNELFGLLISGLLLSGMALLGPIFMEHRSMAQMLRNVIEHFPGVVFWKDSQSVYQGCNRSFSTAAGLRSPDDIVGKTDKDLPWATTEAVHYQADDRQVMDSGVPKLHILETQHQADNRVAWFDTSKVPILDQDGARVLGVLGVSSDITERKKAEDALRHAYDELEDRVVERTAQLADSNRQLQQEVAERRNAEEELRKVLVDLKSMQGQLLQAEKMATVGQLAAGVAHEINNPAGFVMSNLDVLKWYTDDLKKMLEKYREVEGQLESYLARTEDTQVAKLLAEIDQFRREKTIDDKLDDLPALTRESLEGMLRIKSIVTDLKSFSHSDQGHWEQADVHELLQSALNIAWNEIKYKAELIKQYGELPKIGCYPQQLSQVFLNLLVNASQAIEGKGKITVRTLVDGNDIVVEISDTGRGMTEQVREHVFEPFFTTKPVGKGTGLGLSLAYNIIQKHRGKISVVSKPGEGATFTICLPKEV